MANYAGQSVGLVRNAAPAAAIVAAIMLQARSAIRVSQPSGRTVGPGVQPASVRTNARAVSALIALSMSM